MINTLGPISKMGWEAIKRQIGEPTTLEDYRKLYKIVDGRVVEFTEEEYKRCKSQTDKH